MYMEDEDMEDEEEEEEEGGRRGCIQNEYPHIKEWWEKMPKNAEKMSPPQKKCQKNVFVDICWGGSVFEKGGDIF